MGKRNFLIEIGRVVQINYGELAGKICVIVDVIDQNRALVDGPFKLTGVKRQQITFKRLSLTPIRVNCSRGAKEAALLKALTEEVKDQDGKVIKENALNQWKATSWAKKIAKKATQANLNDFERFQALRLKAERNFLIKNEVAKLRGGQ